MTDDELKRGSLTKNLYDLNDLEVWRDSRELPMSDLTLKQRRAYPKVMFLCRAELLSESPMSYVSWFVPIASDDQDMDSEEEARNFFDEIHIAKFSVQQREQYFAAYVSRAMRSRLLSHINKQGQIMGSNSTAVSSSFSSSSSSSMQLPKMDSDQRKALGASLSSRASFGSNKERDLFRVQLESLLNALCDDSGSCKVTVKDACADIEGKFEDLSHFSMISNKDDSDAANNLDAIDVDSDDDDYEDDDAGESTKMDFVHWSLSTAVLTSALRYGGGPSVVQNLFMKDLYTGALKAGQDSTVWTLLDYVERFARLEELDALTTTPFMLKICTIILLQLGELEATPAQIKRSLLMEQNEKLIASHGGHAVTGKLSEDSMDKALKERDERKEDFLHNIVAKACGVTHSEWTDDKKQGEEIQGESKRRNSIYAKEQVRLEAEFRAAGLQQLNELSDLVLTSEAERNRINQEKQIHDEHEKQKKKDYETQERNEEIKKIKKFDRDKEKTIRELKKILSEIETSKNEIETSKTHLKAARKKNEECERTLKEAKQQADVIASKAAPAKAEAAPAEAAPAEAAPAEAAPAEAAPGEEENKEDDEDQLLLKAPIGDESIPADRKEEEEVPMTIKAAHGAEEKQRQEQKKYKDLEDFFEKAKEHLNLKQKVLDLKRTEHKELQKKVKSLGKMMRELLKTEADRKSRKAKIEKDAKDLLVCSAYHKMEISNKNDKSECSKTQTEETETAGDATADNKTAPKKLVVKSVTLRWHAKCVTCVSFAYKSLDEKNGDGDKDSEDGDKAGEDGDKDIKDGVKDGEDGEKKFELQDGEYISAISGRFKKRDDSVESWGTLTKVIIHTNWDRSYHSGDKQYGDIPFKSEARVKNEDDKFGYQIVGFGSPPPDNKTDPEKNTKVEFEIKNGSPVVLSRKLIDPVLAGWDDNIKFDLDPLPIYEEGMDRTSWNGRCEDGLKLTENANSHAKMQFADLLCTICQTNTINHYCKRGKDGLGCKVKCCTECRKSFRERQTAKMIKERRMTGFQRDPAQDDDHITCIHCPKQVKRGTERWFCQQCKETTCFECRPDNRANGVKTANQDVKSKQKRWKEQLSIENIPSLRTFSDRVVELIYSLLRTGKYMQHIPQIECWLELFENHETKNKFEVQKIEKSLKGNGVHLETFKALAWVRSIFRRKKIDRFTIYSTFTESLLKTSISKDGAQHHLTADELAVNARSFSRQLSVQMTFSNISKVVFESGVRLYKRQNVFDRFFDFQEDAHREDVYKVSPVEKSGEVFSFIHKSIQEYLCCDAIVNDIESSSKGFMQETLSDYANELPLRAKEMAALNLEYSGGNDASGSPPGSPASMRSTSLRTYSTGSNSFAATDSDDVPDRDTVLETLVTMISKITLAKAKQAAKQRGVRSGLRRKDVVKLYRDAQRDAELLLVLLDEAKESCLNKLDLGGEEAILDFVTDCLLRPDSGWTQRLDAVARLCTTRAPQGMVVLSKFHSNMRAIYTCTLPKRGGSTPFHEAAASGNLSLMQAIIRYWWESGRPKSWDLLEKKNGQVCCFCLCLC